MGTWEMVSLHVAMQIYAIQHIPFGQLVLKLGIWSGTSSPWLPTRTQKRNAQVTQRVLGTVMGDTFAKSKKRFLA